MIIQAKKIIKNFVKGEMITKVLRGVDLDVKEGEWIAIMGKSGAGKSTLLYQLSLLDEPTSGTIHVDGVNVSALSTNERTSFRLNHLGYVFQDYALVPELTALENVVVPLLMRDMASEEAEKRALTILEKVQLGHRANNLPSQLSGGEQQRVSIARAIVQKPKILFADEPTANLDSSSSENIVRLLSEIHKAGQTIIMVTHEKEYTRLCDRVIYLEDGLIVKE